MKKIVLTRKGFKLILGSAILHFLGVIITLFWGGKKLVDTEFNLFFHLLQFFSWWSVWTSFLTIWAAVLTWKNRKKSPAYFSQFITFLATIYNLITFFFWTYCLFFHRAEMWEKSWFLNIQMVIWHFVAPLLTIFYFYFSAQINLLTKKLFKALLLAFIAPVFYFFYVYVLAKINRPTSSLFPYMKKYPYFIFEWITERKWKWFIFNFLVACLVFLAVCSLLLWTKSLLKINNNINKEIKKTKI